MFNLIRRTKDEFKHNWCIAFEVAQRLGPSV